MSTLVEKISNELATNIANESIRPGSLLESIRVMAAKYNTTIPTIQRVIERLSAMGFVFTEHGRGTIVKNIHQDGNMAAWPYVLGAASKYPEQARDVFKDLIDTHFMLFREVVSQILNEPTRYSSLEFARELEKLNRIWVKEEIDYGQLIDRQCTTMQAALKAVNRPYILAIANETIANLKSDDRILRALFDTRLPGLVAEFEFLRIWQAGEPRPELVEVFTAVSKAESVRILDAYVLILTKESENKQ